MLFYIYKFMRIWGWFAVVTLLFSLLIMLTCSNIFKVSEKKRVSLLIPLYNLIIFLDIVNMNRFYFILLLFPVVNILVIYIMLYRLSIVFHTTKSFAFGLIFLPIVFLPILNFSGNLDNRSSDEIEQEDLKKETINLLTESQIDLLNSESESTPKVDNELSSRFIENTLVISEVQQRVILPYNINTVKEILLNDDKEKKIEKVEPVIVTEDIKKPSRFISDNLDEIKKQEENDNIEIIEL